MGKSRIKVPNEIKIGVHAYGVEYNPHLWMEEELKGSANHISQKIQIEPALAKSQQDVTFLHEVLHIINDQYRLRLSDDDVDRIANGWADFLFNNLQIEFDWSDIIPL